MIVSEIMGGLGNQMFQYACGRALAEKNHTSLELDISWFLDASRQYDLRRFHIQEYICHNENILKLKDSGRLYRIKNRLLNNLKIVDEKKVEKEGYKFPSGINLYLRGYWQSEEYFSKIADALRKEFVLKDDLSENSIRWEQKILETPNSVSVHIRRGDYITSKINRKIYRAIPIEYYYQCLSVLKEKYGNITVFVFSNDIPWVKENLKLDVSMYYVEGNDEEHGYEDMHLMSLCHHNIIANSTFSWWGGWLNRHVDKMVFSPLKWFNIDSYENENLLPNEWIKY